MNTCPPRRLLVVLSSLALLVLGACGEAPSTPGSAPEGAVHLDAHRWLGDAVEVDGLTVWPVFTDQVPDLGEFLTLEEAESRKLAVVREVGSSGGAQQGLAQNDASAPDPQVPTLPIATTGQVQEEEIEDAEEGGEPAQQRGQVLIQDGQILENDIVLGDAGPMVNTLEIENRGDLPILVCAGTIVKGGQQDRQIGQDFVIAARSTVPVDAFCVEPGRWHTRGGGAAAFEFRNAELGIAVKNVRASGQYAKDQGKVWNEVGQVLRDSGITGTDTLVAAAEQVDEKALEHRRDLEAKVRAHFENLSQGDTAPVGFAYAINGNLVTVRTFAHPRLLADHLPAFTKAMALETELAADTPTKPIQAQDVVAFVQEINAAEALEVETRGLNANRYKEAGVGYNGTCVVEDPKAPGVRMVLTEDWTAK